MALEPNICGQKSDSNLELSVASAGGFVGERCRKESLGTMGVSSATRLTMIRTEGCLLEQVAMIERARDDREAFRNLSNGDLEEEAAVNSVVLVDLNID